MTARSVARVELDGTVRSRIASGVNSVFVNDKKAAHEGSVTMRGNTVVQGSKTVFVEDEPLARSGDLVTREGPIIDGSQDVFAD